MELFENHLKPFQNDKKMHTSLLVASRAALAGKPDFM